MTEIKAYRETVEIFYKTLMSIPEEISAIKPSDDSWSLREIVGHLIDSASNNHQRFVRLQLDDLLDFPVYEAEAWVQTQNYNNVDWRTLVALWYHYNCLLINVIENADEKTFDNVWVKNEESIPLLELIQDYYKHMSLHIEHFNRRHLEISRL